MLYFLSDYTEGAHPKVLQYLTERNAVSLPGYGFDPDTEAAKAKINAACGRDDLQIWFLTGGTQTNQLAISCMLQSCEGVIAAETGHVCGHEAGAIEYSGHKVLTVPPDEGRVTAQALRAYMTAFLADDSREHLVQPGMVYISHPTELGTLYSKAQLTELSDCCREYGLKLYMDGARLGYGLASPQSDLELGDICRLCDAFYIGGTKVGALCGEALVFTGGNMPPHFLALHSIPSYPSQSEQIHHPGNGRSQSRIKTKHYDIEHSLSLLALRVAILTIIFVHNKVDTR